MVDLSNNTLDASNVELDILNDSTTVLPLPPTNEKIVLNNRPLQTQRKKIEYDNVNNNNFVISSNENNVTFTCRVFYKKIKRAICILIYGFLFFYMLFIPSVYLLYLNQDRFIEKPDNFIVKNDTVCSCTNTTKIVTINTNNITNLTNHINDIVKIVINNTTNYTNNVNYSDIYQFILNEFYKNIISFHSINVSNVIYTDEIDSNSIKGNSYEGNTFNKCVRGWC